MILNLISTEQATEILLKLSNHYGEVKPDLIFANEYELIIAVVLSAQTTDIQVNKVTKKLFANYPNFKKLSEANTKDIELLINSIGFFRNKSKNIINLSKIVCEIYNNKLPSSMEELIKLPGVGRKTANIIRSENFNIPAFAVDTHVIKLSNRLGLANSQNPNIVEKQATSIIPRSWWSAGHLLFIRHGRDICKKRNPNCNACPIIDLCLSSYIFSKKSE